MRTLPAVAVVAAVLLLSAPANAIDCAQPLSGGDSPIASDCLFILKSAVGTETCEPDCVCAPKGTTPVTATDALICLNVAVGQPVSLNCPCQVTTTINTTTTTVIVMPFEDIDNDGISDLDDPCPEEALNRCFGPVAIDRTAGIPVRINAINPRALAFSCRGARTDCNGDVWGPDFGFNQAGEAFKCNIAVNNCGISGLAEIFGCTNKPTTDIFKCEHYDKEEAPELVYSFDVPDGLYLVNLLFAEVFTGTVTVGARVFDVAIESVVRLDDFDVIKAAGAAARAIVRSFVVDVSDGDGLQIEFLHEVQNPAVKGIEVLTAAPPS